MDHKERMDDNDAPSKEQFRYLMLPFVQAIAATAAIKYHDESRDFRLLAAQKMIDKTDILELSVCGNRPMDNSITWGDIKLIAAGYLRLMLEELEAS